MIKTNFIFVQLFYYWKFFDVSRAKKYKEGGILSKQSSKAWILSTTDSFQCLPWKWKFYFCIKANTWNPQEKLNVLSKKYMLVVFNWFEHFSHLFYSLNTLKNIPLVTRNDCKRDKRVFLNKQHAQLALNHEQ